MRSRILTLAAVLVLVSAVGGCFTRHAVTVDYDAGTVTVSKGDLLRVDMGDYNPSIGDNWTMVSTSKPAVLKAESDKLDGCGDDRPGCGGTLYWQFSTIGTGTETLRFQYCFRSAPPHCTDTLTPGRGPSAPQQLVVTVR